jgi:hypothetical protein
MIAKAACSALLLCALGAPAFADTYPVSGRWGVSQSSDKNPIDCSKLRVIAFNGNQRTDSGGGVPTFRNLTVTPSGGGWQVVDEFNTVQVQARARFMLRQVDPVRIEMDLQPGPQLKLHKCK